MDGPGQVLVQSDAAAGDGPSAYKLILETCPVGSSGIYRFESGFESVPGVKNNFQTSFLQ